MTARATYNDTVIAESDDTIIVEGNHYFPPTSVRREHLVPSDTQTHCPWKGDASYYTVQADAGVEPDGAWYYPQPFAAAEEIRDYVAFWRGVKVTAEPTDGRPGPTPPPRR
ncbi:MAG TPA: DUF427 domain-containing protein [Acidimicrobiales bacterium]|jgi:uncharacterized protein (DUF427 family)